MLINKTSYRFLSSLYECFYRFKQIILLTYFQKSLSSCDIERSFQIVFTKMSPRVLVFGKVWALSEDLS